jgi:hypothetical protein
MDADALEFGALFGDGDPEASLMAVDAAPLPPPPPPPPPPAVLPPGVHVGDLLVLAVGPEPAVDLGDDRLQPLLPGGPSGPATHAPPPTGGPPDPRALPRPVAHLPAGGPGTPAFCTRAPMAVDDDYDDGPVPLVAAEPAQALAARLLRVDLADATLAPLSPALAESE